MTSNHHSQESQEASANVIRAGLVLSLLFSSFFALYHSNTAYSSDEVWSIKTAGLNPSAGIAALKADVHPPLYFQILHYWIRMFGTGERAVRGLSGLFYILSIVALYHLGQGLYGTRVALLSASLYLSSPLAIISAQFARMYALLSLLSILSTWLYLQFSIKPRDSHVLFAIYVAANILGTFTHIGFFFLLFGQIIFHLLFYRQTRMMRFVIAMGLSLVPYMFFWAPILLGQIANSREGIAWVKKPGLSMVADLLLNFGGAFWLVVPVLLYVWWRTGFHSLRGFSKLNITTLPLWLLAVTLLTPLLISEIKPIFNSRLAIVGLHLFALTIAALIGRASNYLLPLLLVLLTAFAIFFHHPGSAICDSQGIATYLSQTANDGDVVIFTSLTRLPIDYYLERTPTTRKLFETSFPAEIDSHPGFEGRINDPARQAALEREAQELVDKIAGMQFRQIFFIHGRYPEIDSLVEKRLRERFELLPAQGVKCGETPYFKELSVYR